MYESDDHNSGERVSIVLLEREWRTLRHSIPAERYRGWAEQQPLLRRFANVGALVRFLQDEDQGDGASRDKDAVLCALLALAQQDALAGRVALQALLPGLKQLARRALFDLGEREVFWELLLAHAWARIRSYPLSRRRHSVAANLLFDSLQRTLRELGRERRQHRQRDTQPAHDQPLAGRDEEPELVLRDAVRARAISTLEARLIFTVRLERRRLADAAAAEGLAYNVARVRLQRAEQRLLTFLGLPPAPSRRSATPSLRHESLRERLDQAWRHDRQGRTHRTLPS